MRTNVVICLNGNYLSTTHSFLDVLSPGVLEGEGIFETIRVYDKNVPFFKMHYARLAAGIKFYKLGPPPSGKDILEIIRGLLSKNEIRNARVRLAFWRKGAEVRNAVVCQEFILPSSAYAKGFKAVVSSLRCPRRQDPLIKSLNYSLYRKSYLMAREKGGDEAVLLNSRNEVSEGSRSNLFFFKEGMLCTPSLACGCLNGITRRLVIKIARQQGVPCRSGRYSLDDLLNADEVFVTNSLLELISVVQINNYHLRKMPRRRSVMLRLLTHYRRLRDCESLLIQSSL